MKNKLKFVLGVGLVATSTSYGAIVNVGSETPLYNLLGMPNNNYVQPVGDNTSAKQTSEQTWNTAIGNQYSSLLVEIAGNAGVNEFGIYDVGNIGNILQIYPGPAVGNPNVSKQLSILGSSLSVSGGGSITLTGSGTDFGFYLKNTSSGVTFYSQTSKNSGGVDQLATFDINDTKYGQLPYNNNNTGFLLAWEDIAYNSSDKDFNDMVVTFTAAPIPEPTTIIAGALLLLPFGASTIRYFRKNRVA